MDSHLPPNHEHLDDQMVKMEVNLDDIPGEWLGYVMDLLFDAGANVLYPYLYEKKSTRNFTAITLFTKKC